MNPPTIWPAVDMIVTDGSKVLIAKRQGPPFKGLWKFPGGMVDDGETVEEAAVRETKEETGLDVEITDILGVYSSPTRDPRRHTMAIVFIMRPINGELKMNEESTELKWVSFDEIPDGLGFDHSKIAQDFKKWLKHKGTYWSTRQA
ncbi:NUDIX hydrolase [archaeon]|nr:MAG: NUDIX hydrolase [archaeon]